MHHFQYLAIVAIAASLLGGCPETVSCGEGEQYSPVTRRCADGDGGTDIVDSGIDAPMDAGPCQARCPIDFCDPVTDTCLDCRVSEGNADCEDTPETSVCDEGTCVPCSVDAECPFVGTPECTDEGCVACTPENEAEVCGEFTCNPSTFRCTDVRPRTIGTCLVCVADSQCATTHRCVPMEFEDTQRGGRCLQVVAPSCDTKPFTTVIEDRRSLSGEEGLDFCGVNEALTTCEAVLAFEASCGTPGMCPDVGTLCRTIDASSNICTYPCSGTLQCPDGRMCPTSGERYCQ